MSAAPPLAEPMLDEETPGVEVPEGAPCSDLDEESAPFPVACLPPVLAEMVESVASTMRVPAAMPGVCALGIVSAALGKGLIMNTLPSKSTAGNLYIMAAVESGTGKSETFKHVARPFTCAAKQAISTWKSTRLADLLADKELIEWERLQLRKAMKVTTDRAALKAKLVDLQTKSESVERELAGPVYSVEDCTVEKLALLLQNNGECLASLSADAGSIVNNLLGRYNKAKRTDEDIYLKAFSRDPVQVARMGRESIDLAEPVLTCLWFTQPDKLVSLMQNESLRDGGLLPRFLVCDTGAELQLIDEHMPPISPCSADAYGSLIANLFGHYRGAKTPFMIPDSPEARHVIIEYTNEVIERRKADLRDVGPFAARWAEQAWRISMVLHAALHGIEAREHPVSAETAGNAVQLVRWFSAQQLEILAPVRGKKAQSEKTQVLKLAMQKRGGFTARDVQRKHITRKASQARSLLDEMVDEGSLLFDDIVHTGGSPTSRVYKLALRPFDR